MIHRLSLSISSDRTIYLHHVHPCDHAYMHSHSWPFALRVLEGGYEMGVGFSTDRSSPPQAVHTIDVGPGTMYEMVSPDVWHYTRPTPGMDSFSVMLVGPRIRPRLALNNSGLSTSQFDTLMDRFRRFYPA